MTKQFVIDYIDKKIEENENYIRYTFYELRIKNNLSEEDLEIFLKINKDYFENKGYMYILQELNLAMKMQIEWYNLMNL